MITSPNDLGDLGNCSISLKGENNLRIKGAKCEQYLAHNRSSINFGGVVIFFFNLAGVGFTSASWG